MYGVITYVRNNVAKQITVTQEELSGMMKEGY